MPRLVVKNFMGVMPRRYRISAKLDGIQAIFIPSQKRVISRAGSTLYGLNHILPLLPSVDSIPTEVYFKRSEDSQQVCGKYCSSIPIEHVYDLLGVAQGVLPCPKEYPTPDVKLALADGFEGIVILDLDTNIGYRIKPNKTIDLPILGLEGGFGKNRGKLGAFVTARGSVGTGFTDYDRARYYDKRLIGKIIEVKYQRETCTGALRHPVFVRFRPDKEK